MTNPLVIKQPIRFKGGYAYYCRKHDLLMLCFSQGLNHASEEHCDSDQWEREDKE